MGGIKYGPPKAVDREFMYKKFARTPETPKIDVFHFFTGVLGPGRCLDGFAPHFSCRYTPSDPNFIIPDPHPLKFREHPKKQKMSLLTFSELFSKKHLS